MNLQLRTIFKKTDYKIIIDQPASDVPDFKKYSERLSQIIANSKPQFKVGIFGGWGTGKTTMMKMIENEIKKNYSDVATTL
jgi:ABC-type phosphate/phosphonate transport system ATPase subunit